MVAMAWVVALGDRVQAAGREPTAASEGVPKGGRVSLRVHRTNTTNTSVTGHEQDHPYLRFVQEEPPSKVKVDCLPFGGGNVCGKRSKRHGREDMGQPHIERQNMLNKSANPTGQASGKLELH